MKNLMTEIRKLALESKKSASILRGLVPALKNKLLDDISHGIVRNTKQILNANEKDLTIALRNKRDDAFIDRLSLDSNSIKKISETTVDIRRMDDPVGTIESMRVRPNGLRVGQMRVPIGVISIIYEARPNVTVDAASLCLKSGNACILRGGSDASLTNNAFVDVIHNALKKNVLPVSSVTLIPFTDYNAIKHLVRLEGIVDCVIPRGGEGLIRSVVKYARVPVIKHYLGNCHIYIDYPADLSMAINVAVNAKTERYSVCNAMETLLVNERISDVFLPLFYQSMQKHGVEIRGCKKTSRILPGIKTATESDWKTEFLAPILAVKIVSNIDEAISHIERYGSNHTDGIITSNQNNAERFIKEVDSSSVMVNASTRFADGGEYGLGAEIGISTDKLHVRGPMGLIDLTTKKYIVIGDGHIRTSK